MHDDEDSDDDVPISVLRKNALKKRPPAPTALAVKREREVEVGQTASKRAKHSNGTKASSAKTKERTSPKEKAAPSTSDQKKKKKVHRETSEPKGPSKSDNSRNKQATSDVPVKKKQKELSLLQRVDEAIKAYQWWTADELPDGQVFRTLEHNGVLFAPAYEPHGVKLLYDGREVDLGTEQEEVATYYAAIPDDGPQLSEKGGQRETFQKNFFADFIKVLGKGSPIKRFDKCDFSRIKAHLDRQRSAKKAATDAEKKDARASKEAEQLRIGYALLDGKLQKVGNFRMEPPSLFRGRGKHPKTGTLKQRTMPEQVAINVGACNAPPRCDIPGHAWGSVQHDNTVTWLSSWHENVMSQNKYVMLAANSSLKGKSDFHKFEKSQQLKGCIDRVRRDYRANLRSADTRTAQLATTMWLIDVYALRVGGEKGEDEADTVGCCSLRVEHFTFSKHDGAKEVVLEFLGKDSMLFKQTIDFASFDVHGQCVYDNIKRFCRHKRPHEQVFDTISPPDLNAHLSSIMPGLTAKVFRTYNASETLQNELPSASDMKKLDTVNAKLVAYNEANRTVAILCNHQRTVSAATQVGLENLQGKLAVFKQQKRELQEWKKLFQADKAHKIPLRHEVDPMAKAQAAVDAAKDMKNKAKTVEDKVAATKAAEAAAIAKRHAQKERLHHMHKYTKQPTSDKDVEKRIVQWAEKIKKCEIELRNKNENKEVSLGTSKANYCDPRISVAWCKRCDVPVERIFPKTLFEKFAWAMTVGPDWRFEAVPLKQGQPGAAAEDDDDDADGGDEAEDDADDDDDER